MPNRIPVDTDGMTGPRSTLRMPGHNRSILLSSPLSAEEAVVRLSREMTASQDDAIPWLLDRRGERVVQGKVSRDRIRLAAGLYQVQNSCRPVLRARLVTTPHGCQLTGKLGLLPHLRGFLFVLAATLSLGGILALGQLALDAPNIHSFVALMDSTMPLLGVVTAGSIVVGFFSLLTWLGRKDGDYLMTWVSTRLEVESVAAEYGPEERT